MATIDPSETNQKKKSAIDPRAVCELSNESVAAIVPHLFAYAKRLRLDPVEREEVVQETVSVLLTGAEGWTRDPERPIVELGFDILLSKSGHHKRAAAVARERDDPDADPPTSENPERITLLKEEEEEYVGLREELRESFDKGSLARAIIDRADGQKRSAAEDGARFDVRIDQIYEARKSIKERIHEVVERRRKRMRGGRHE